jgi:hypothetical protein
MCREVSFFLNYLRVWGWAIIASIVVVGGGDGVNCILTQVVDT